MKAPHQKLLLIIFIFTLFFSSCEKDMIPAPEETPDPPCWTVHPEVELDRRLLIQSFTTDENIYLLSNNYFLKMDEDNLLVDHLISESGNLSLYRYPMLNDKLFAIGLDINNLEKLEIFSTQHPTISATIDLPAIDSSFQEINYFSGNGMCANDDNKLLFSVSKKYVSGVSDSSLYFWMFDFTLENDHLTIEFDKEIKIEIPENASASLTEMVVYENEFYCSISLFATYKINSQGQYEELFPLRDAKVFLQNDTLFALGHAWGCFISYAIKPPQSNSWQSYSTGVDDGCWGKFYQIDGRFVMVNRNQFWELKIQHSDGTFDINELDNNCLGLTSIRTLFEFKDKVYLTTHDGLFFKNREDFFNK